jgi:hypothetical protein
MLMHRKLRITVTDVDGVVLDAISVWVGKDKPVLSVRELSKDADDPQAIGELTIGTVNEKEV